MRAFLAIFLILLATPTWAGGQQQLIPFSSTASKAPQDFYTHCLTQLPQNAAPDTFWFTEFPCHPEQFAEIGDGYHYGVYAYCDGEWCNYKLLILFKGTDFQYNYPSQLTPLYALPYELGVEYLVQPKIISGNKDILLVRLAIDGTARSVTDYAVELHSSPARILDTESWRSDIKYPTGTTITHGRWIDYHNLNTTIYLHREGDANCCHSGGEIEVKFRWNNGRLVVDNSHYVAPSSN